LTAANTSSGVMCLLTSPMQERIRKGECGSVSSSVSQGFSGRNLTNVSCEKPRSK
jgi:hypothetical protein